MSQALKQICATLGGREAGKCIGSKLEDPKIRLALLGQHRGSRRAGGSILGQEMDELVGRPAWRVGWRKDPALMPDLHPRHPSSPGQPQSGCSELHH